VSKSIREQEWQHVASLLCPVRISYPGVLELVEDVHFSSLQVWGAL
jgi:hypothetical protein